MTKLSQDVHDLSRHLSVPGRCFSIRSIHWRVKSNTQVRKTSIGFEKA